MALTTMYNGQVNSPQTALNGSINSSVTSITVVDATILPTAPMPLVISEGTKEPETVLMTNKVGNVLTVTRAFQGVAQSWSDGASIGRNFTAYDYNTLVENATTINNDLVGHKADGTLHAKTARFVIGTSTAGWTSKDVDYLCDGTEDQVEINNAITALPATGGEIVILDGTYNITAKIDVTKDNVSIRGNGNATILKRMFDSASAEGVITLTGRSGCKIADLQVDGNKGSYTDYNNYSIYLDASSNNTFTGNTCNTNSNYGIHLGNSSNNNNITGNTCSDNEYGGISLSSSSKNTITNNTCNDNGWGMGIDISNSNDNVIIGNTCNTNYRGIIISSSSKNTITNNTCNNNEDGTGIYLYTSNDNTITGNSCNNNDGGTGIDLYTSSNSTITGNTCNNNSTGIILNDSSNNNTVTGNTCSDNNCGIYLSSSSNNAVTGNTCIRGTGLTTDYTASQHTIQLVSTGNNYNLISNNNCMGKAVTNGGGTGNSVYGNKYDSGDYKDFTLDEKTKLAGIATGANNTTVVNNLTSTSTTSALSANQGKVLAEQIRTIKVSSTAFTTGTLPVGAIGFVYVL